MAETLEENLQANAQTNLQIKLQKLLGPSIESLGCRLMMVEVKGKVDLIVQIFVERLDKAVLKVNDCRSVSRHISAILDVEDIIDADYTLEVSSLGIDRPLFERADYEYYLGLDARIEFKNRIHDHRNFKGKMIEIKDELLLLQNEGGRIEVPFENIKRAKLILTDALIVFARNQNSVKH